MLACFLERFERGGDEIRLYDVKHFVKKMDGDRYYYHVLYPNGRKNTQFENNQNRNIQPYKIWDRTKLFWAMDTYLTRRGIHVTKTAFYLQPYPEWRLNDDNQSYGYKNAVIGKNSFEKLLSHGLKVTGVFENNIMYTINGAGKKVEHYYFTVASVRKSLFTVSAASGLNHINLQKLGIHTNVTTTDRYIRAYKDECERLSSVNLLKFFLQNGRRACMTAGDLAAFLGPQALFPPHHQIPTTQRRCNANPDQLQLPQHLREMDTLPTTTTPQSIIPSDSIANAHNHNSSRRISNRHNHNLSRSISNAHNHNSSGSILNEGNINSSQSVSNGHINNSSQSISNGHSINSSRSISNEHSINSSRSMSNGHSINSSRSISNGHSINSSRSISNGHSINSSRSMSNGHIINSSRSISNGHSINSARSISSGHSVNSSRSISNGHIVNSSQSISNGHIVNSSRSISNGHINNTSRPISNGHNSNSSRSPSNGNNSNSSRPVSNAHNISSSQSVSHSKLPQYLLPQSSGLNNLISQHSLYSSSQPTTVNTSQVTLNTRAAFFKRLKSLNLYELHANKDHLNIGPSEPYQPTNITPPKSQFDKRLRKRSMFYISR